MPKARSSRRVVVLIPAYQPDVRLVELVTSIRTAAGALAVVVVDDGSGDSYRAVFDQVEDRGAVVTGYGTNRGKGAALKHGFSAVERMFDGWEVICADVDGQHRCSSSAASSSSQC